MATIADLGARAKRASRVLATASTTAKDAGLHAAADLLVDRTNDILDANAADVATADDAGTTATVVDRLRLTAARVARLIAARALPVTASPSQAAGGTCASDRMISTSSPFSSWVTSGAWRPLMRQPTQLSPMLVWTA